MSGVADQAEGLRKLLAIGRTRMVAVLGLSAGVGATTTATNLGVELARRGERVLLLDEHPWAPGSAAHLWGAAPKGSLQDVAERRASFESVAKPIGVAGQQLLLARGPLPAGFNPRPLCRDGVIVVDAALDRRGQFSSLATAADDVVIVIQPTAASITAAYAGLKQMQFTHALQTFQFVVNETTTARQAQTVITNIVNTSSRYLAVGLRPLGWIGHDILVRESARLQKTVCEAYPAAAAAVDIRQVLAALLGSGRTSEAPAPVPARSAAFQVRAARAA